MKLTGLMHAQSGNAKTAIKRFTKMDWFPKFKAHVFRNFETYILLILVLALAAFEWWVFGR
jgi:hypothetical protein